MSLPDYVPRRIVLSDDDIRRLNEESETLAREIRVRYEKMKIEARNMRGAAR